MALNPDELKFFREKGYVVKRHLFQPSYIRQLADEIDGLHDAMAKAAPKTVHVSWEEGQAEGRAPRIRQLMHSDKVSPIIEAMSRSDSMLSIMQQLIGPDVYLFHSKLMMKSAHDGTFTPWHQDWGYWQHSALEPSQINCMLAIDPNIEANGALRFVEGSQARGPVSHREFASKSFNIGLEGDIDSYDSVMVEMQPGDAVFFGPLVIHGSAANLSEFDRRANTFAFDKPGNQKQGELPAQYYRTGTRASA